MMKRHLKVNNQNRINLINKEKFHRFLSTRRYLAENTIRHCVIRLGVIKRWMTENNCDFTVTGIEEFISYLRFDKKLTDNSISCYFYALVQIEYYLLDMGLIDVPVLGEFRRPRKVINHINILTLDEIERLINAYRTYKDRNGVTNEGLGFFYSTFIMFLALTGCRFSEAANLRVKNLDFESDKAIVEFTKIKIAREIYFTEPLKSKLMKLSENKRKNDLVFTYGKGKRLSQQTFSAELFKRAKIANIKKRVYAHLFRHSFATQLLLSGVELSYVSSLIGHVSIETTFERYIHLADATRRQAMFMHPLIRQSINIKEIINIVKLNLNNLRLDADDRFNYEIKEQNGKITFALEAKT